MGPRGVTLLRDREPLPVEELSEDAEPRDAAACGDTRFAVLDAGNAAVLVRARRGGLPARGLAGW